MIQEIPSTPNAGMLLTSLRSVGYSEQAAIADLVDNCIAAEAMHIDITFDFEKEQILIVDDGLGMTKAELIDNMRIGSSNPEKERAENDLGRFGMGLKTAAFSLGTRLTVISKKEEECSNACWDLEKASELGWKLLVQDNEELEQYFSLIKEQGTCIVIEHLDRIIDSKDRKKAKSKFYDTIKRVSEHLSLVFHRFLEDELSITINHQKLQPWSPFVENWATQEFEQIDVTNPDNEKSTVIIQPYVLPHRLKFKSEEEYERAGGVYGWNDQQGIYLYRNKRVIVAMDWLRLAKKEPAFQLARICIDITSDADFDWKIDIKKSTASIPTFARKALEKAVEVCTEGSKKVYNSRGTYSKSNQLISNKIDYVWEQCVKHGQYNFKINRNHNFLVTLRNKLTPEDYQQLEAYLRLIETCSPWVNSGLYQATCVTGKDNDKVQERVENLSELNEMRNIIQLCKSSHYEQEEIKDFFEKNPIFKSLFHAHPELLEEEE